MKFLLKFVLLFIFGVNVHAQIQQQTTGQFEKIVFDSHRKWTAARWYAIGQWVGPNRVKWLGGGQSVFKFPTVACLDSKNPVGHFERKIEEKSTDVLNLEILKSKNFFAIEVPATQVLEKFSVFPGNQAQTSDEKCKIEVEIKYSWLQGPGDVRPLLFLSPQKNKYFGYEIHLQPPVDKPESAADICMDLMLGYSYASFPNADPSGNTKLHLFPVAKTRGEWVPFKKLFGLKIGLEQVMASWGGAENQQTLYSDWTVGTFLETFVPVFDAIHLRAGFNYYEHLADDNIATPTFALTIKESKYFTTTGSMNIYFADYWLLGGAFEYALPSSLADVGVKQSMLAITGRLGLRVTGFMFLLFEGGMRDYKAVGSETERVFQGFGGIRLDL